MRRIFAAVLILCAAVGAGPRARGQAYEARPKLVVILVIDQFRGDYLDRYRESLTSANGFNLFLRKGAYFGSCYFDYANTKTAPGHATIGTGAYTDGHGISSNEWWDTARKKGAMVSSVEDERYRLVGTFDDAGARQVGASPLNLRATTIGDEVRLATGGQAKLYGISLKDRASILPAGQTANAAYWIDQATGRFETSTYYMAKLPDWVTEFNKGPRPGEAAKEAGLAGTSKFYEEVGKTPAANHYELDFAQALIENEKLGEGQVTDVLTVSLSANDIMGHANGPDSPQEREMVLGLDRDLNGFFTWLDRKVGLGNVMVALTADHGVAPTIAKSSGLGVASARVDMKKLTAGVERLLNERLSPGQNSQYLMPTEELPYLELNEPAFGKMTEREAEQAVAEVLPAAMAEQTMPRPAAGTFSETRLAASPAIGFLRTKADLEDGKIPATQFGELISHSLSSNGGWWVMLFPGAYQMEVGSGTTHFSPWSYDRHVPLGFFGAAFVPGYYREQVAPVDIAATFASLLGVNRPSAAVGRVLTFALKPGQTAR